MPDTNKSILGQFSGECADASITNLNGLDITREVWEYVFNSDDFKKAIDLGWYIGFLGHPEDPNCMDFKNACIVMTEGSIDDNDKVYGKFNLVDTPVGRTVKSFIDAGVTFGISVRGAGDIVDNSVVPEEFVFRGFDLVSFPAYPDSIPEFTAIAASTDADKQLKYKKVCASVKANLDSITDISALNIIKCQFAKQSDMYKSIEGRISDLTGGNPESSEDYSSLDITDAKLQCMTNLYLEAIEANRQLQSEIKSIVASSDGRIHDLQMQVRSLSRISADTMRSVRKERDAVDAKYKLAVSANKKLKGEVIVAQNNNLKYKRKQDEDIRSKERIIANLQAKLDETVIEVRNLKSSTSNLGEKNKELKSKIEAMQTLLAEYQNAYAGMYANAIGVKIPSMSISSSTDVKGLQKIIANQMVTSKASTIFYEPDIEDLPVDEDEMVTL